MKNAYHIVGMYINIVWLVKFMLLKKTRTFMNIKEIILQSCLKQISSSTSCLNTCKDLTGVQKHQTEHVNEWMHACSMNACAWVYVCV